MSSDLTVAAPASAIGGTSGKWTVTSGGELQPATDSANPIGDATHRATLIWTASGLKFVTSGGDNHTLGNATTGTAIQLTSEAITGSLISILLSFASLTAGRTFTFPDTAGILSLDTPVSSLQTAAGNGETIATASIRLARYTANGAARTGVILAVGTFAGQQITVLNEDTTAVNTITFAASGTSNVAGGVLAIINGNQGRRFVWNGSLWYELK